MPKTLLSAPGLGPYRGFSGSMERRMQRVQKLMRRSVDMIDRSEPFLRLTRGMIWDAFVPARHPHGLHACFLSTPQVADRIFCHHRLDRLNRVCRVAPVVNGGKHFLKNLRVRALF